MSEYTKQIQHFIDKEKDDLLDQIIKLCTIVSPTGKELKKALHIQNQLIQWGAKNVRIDEVGNVIFEYNPSQNDKIILYCAHMDTVFSNIENITPQKKGNLLYAPSSGDNSANVAGLMYLIKYILKHQVRSSLGILFVFTVGEEGLGNLKGMQYVMKKNDPKIKYAIAVDGDMQTVVNKAIGSVRYMVTIKVEGGHSWYDFGKTNAIQVASSIIEKIYEYQTKQIPKTSYNVGCIKGGTSINSIAESSEFTVDLRSETTTDLKDVDQYISQILKETENNHVKIQRTLLGKRPVGKVIDESILIEKLKQIRNKYELETPLSSASTDANIPLSMGIPAISFGIREGQGGHTENEFIKIDSLPKGFMILAEMIHLDFDFHSDTY